VKVRFLADADLNRAIVTGILRCEPSLDFMTAQAAGLRAMNDPEVLALAAERQRILVSHDIGTMPAHFHIFRSARKHSPGVFLIPQSLNVRTAIEELLLIWLASDASEWEDRLEWLPL
jgi:predicted nuclease of predicted toxin-antitoxin system